MGKTSDSVVTMTTLSRRDRKFTNVFGGKVDVWVSMQSSFLEKRQINVK